MAHAHREQTLLSEKDEEQRKEILKEAYKLMQKKKAYQEVKDIFDDLIKHPDSGDYLRDTLSNFKIPQLPELTPEQEIEVEVAKLSVVFGVKNDATKREKIRKIVAANF